MASIYRLQTARDVRAAVSEWARARLTSRRSGAWYAPPRYSIFEGFGQVIDPDGSVAWEDEDWMANGLTNSGQADILNVYLKGSSQTATFYLALASDASGVSAPAKTNTSSDIILVGSATATQIFEEQGGGYARQGISQAQWGTPALNSGDEQSDAAQKTFGPVTGSPWTGSSGTSAALRSVFLSTSSTAGTGGSLLLYVPLSAVTVVAVSQSFSYTLRFKQS
jgi:hypothetical protein